MSDEQKNGIATRRIIKRSKERLKIKNRKALEKLATVAPTRGFPREYIDGTPALSSKKGGDRLPLHGLTLFAAEEIVLLKRRFRLQARQWMTLERWSQFSYAQRRELRAAVQFFHEGKVWLQSLDREAPYVPEITSANSPPTETRNSRHGSGYKNPTAADNCECIQTASLPRVIRASAPDLLKPIHHAREYEAEMRARQAAANEQDDSVVSAHSVTDLETSKHINFAHLTVALSEVSHPHRTSLIRDSEDVTRVSLVLEPEGTKHVHSKTATVTQYSRGTAVRTWVLEAANGRCECCNNDAPFNGDNGLPFLEVHHVRPVSDGGPDTITNVVAICPNCHRELHYGKARKALVTQLYANVTRLVKE